jgi:hypothetical protein
MNAKVAVVVWLTVVTVCRKLLPRASCAVVPTYVIDAFRSSKGNDVR